MTISCNIGQRTLRKAFSNIIYSTYMHINSVRLVIMKVAGYGRLKIQFDKNLFYNKKHKVSDR